MPQKEKIKDDLLPKSKIYNYLEIIEKLLKEKTIKIKLNQDPHLGFTATYNTNVENEDCKKSTVNLIATPIWTLILSFCNYHTLARMELVCKQFFKAINPKCDCKMWKGKNGLREIDQNYRMPCYINESSLLWDDFSESLSDLDELEYWSYHKKCRSLWCGEYRYFWSKHSLIKRKFMGVCANQLLQKYSKLITELCWDLDIVKRELHRKNLLVDYSIHECVCLQKPLKNLRSVEKSCFICANPTLSRSASIIKEIASQCGITLTIETDTYQRWKYNALHQLLCLYL